MICVQQNVTPPRESSARYLRELRTRASWVQILPGAPLNQGLQTCGPFSFLPLLLHCYLMVATGYGLVRCSLVFWLLRAPSQRKRTHMAASDSDSPIRRQLFVHFRNSSETKTNSRATMRLLMHFRVPPKFSLREDIQRLVKKWFGQLIAWELEA